MLQLSLLLAAGLPARLSLTDRTLLAALRESVSRLESRTISREQFEAQQPRSRIPAWQHLQRRLPSTRAGSADLAFVLGYYGVDEPKNLHRLLLPYQRWRHASPRRHAAGRHDEAVARDLPADLEILYRKHRDAASLGALMELEPVEGGIETPGEALSHLWGDDPAPLLRLAAGRPARLRRLAEMLVGSHENPVDRNEIRETLRKLAHRPDARVARAARDVLDRVPAARAWPLSGGAAETSRAKPSSDGKPQDRISAAPMARRRRAEVEAIVRADGGWGCR